MGQKPSVTHPGAPLQQPSIEQICTAISIRTAKIVVKPSRSLALVPLLCTALLLYCLPLFGSTGGGRIPTKTYTGPDVGIGGRTSWPPPPICATPLMAARPDICAVACVVGPLTDAFSNLPILTGASLRTVIYDISYSGPRIEIPHSKPPDTILSARPSPGVPPPVASKVRMSWVANAVPSPSIPYDSITVGWAPPTRFNDCAIWPCCSTVRLRGLNATTCLRNSSALRNRMSASSFARSAACFAAPTLSNASLPLPMAAVALLSAIPDLSI